MRRPSRIAHFFQSCRRGIVALVIAIGLALAFVLINFCWNPSAERQLCAMDAARAVPDGDNAALVYARILQVHKVPFSLSDLEVILDRPQLERIRRDLGLDHISAVLEREPRPHSHPWHRSDFPSTARLLDSYAKNLSVLREAAKQNVCYFPLCAAKLNSRAYARNPDPFARESAWEPTNLNLLLEAIDRYRDLMSCAAYLDLGQGRFRDAIGKAHILIRLGHHLCQFPLERSIYSGLDAELDGLTLVNIAIVTGPSALLPLSEWQATFQSSYGHWLPAVQQTKAAGDLIYQEGRKRNKERNEIGREETESWMDPWKTAVNHKTPSTSRMVPSPGSQSYLLPRINRLTRQYRLLHFLSELRRFKDQTGRWPTHLDEIGSNLADEFSDSLHDTVYPLIWFSSDCFVLHGSMRMSRDKHNQGRFSARDLLVYDGRSLDSHELERVENHVTYFINRALDYPMYNFQLGEYTSRLSAYSMPLLLEGLQHSKPLARSTAIYLLSFMGKRDQAAIYGHSRENLLELLLSGYQKEQDASVQIHYIQALINFRDLPSEEHSFLVGSLRDIITNSPVAKNRGLATCVLLQVSELDGLAEVLDHEERILYTNWFSRGELYYWAIWRYTCNLLSSYGLREYMEERFSGSRLMRASEQQREALLQWWQENRERVISELGSKQIRAHQTN